jgi:excisionase family DNA binding protein
VTSLGLNTTSEAAAKLGIGKTAVLTLVKVGKLKAYRPTAKIIRIPDAELVRHLKEHTK